MCSRNFWLFFICACLFYCVFIFILFAHVSFYFCFILFVHVRFYIYIVNIRIFSAIFVYYYALYSLCVCVFHFRYFIPLLLLVYCKFSFICLFVCFIIFCVFLLIYFMFCCCFISSYDSLLLFYHKDVFLFVIVYLFDDVCLLSILRHFLFLFYVDSLCVSCWFVFILDLFVDLFVDLFFILDLFVFLDLYYLFFILLPGLWFKTILTSPGRTKLGCDYVFAFTRWRSKFLGCLNDVIALKLLLQDGSNWWMKLLLMCCLKLVYGQYVIGKYNFVSFCWFVCFFPMLLIAIFLDILYWYWFGSDGMLYWDVILLYAWLIM